jgi:glutaredoxin/glutathione-dependent peroxiredoxin
LRLVLRNAAPRIEAERLDASGFMQSGSIMPIKVGDRLPSVRFRVMTPEGPAWKSSEEIFKGKKVALFAMPGAFTRGCHTQHMPTVVRNAAALKAKGVDTVAVTCANDPFVLDAWQKATGADQVEFLGDGNLEFAKAIDLVADSTATGMGLRSRRYSMLVDDDVVKQLNVDEPGKFEVSSGDRLLKQL